MGGLLQLVTVGVQDKYIHGNPQITFFRSVYRRHTNFAIESIQQVISGDHITGNGNIGTVTLSKGNGDLVHKIFVEVNQNDNGIIGDEIIDQVELIIGGTLIDTHTNEWLKIWRELSTPESKAKGIKYMCNSFENKLVKSKQYSTNQSSVIIPLLFWFCRYPGVSLPILALQYDDVVLKFKWGDNININKDSSISSGVTCDVWVDYIFLDRDERIRFAKLEHEYLIEQLQYQETSTKGEQTLFKMKFNHPIKELIWTEDNKGANAIQDQKIKITLNDIDRLSYQYKEYYTLKQPYDHHTSIPGYNIKELDRSNLLMNPILIMSGTDKAKTPSISSTDDNFEINSSAPGENGYQGNLRIATSSSGTVEDIRIGDLLAISYPIVGSEEVITIYGTVGDIIKPPVAGVNVGEYTLKFDSGKSGITSDKPPLDSNNGNGSISIIARTQSPHSRCSNLKKNIYVYSFSINPEEHQPSGTMNFSRVNNAKIKIEEAKQIDSIYAVNYNILRFKGGTTSLLYSN